MYQRHQLGASVEREAAHWMKARGGRLIAQNYRCRVGEIDLILEEQRPDGQTELVFVEVRARSLGGWVSGVESVDWKKRRKLSRTIAHFLVHYRGCATAVRVDILGWDGQSWTHLCNAWVA
jgi:putative endonuclease